ncbi:hypothetical protein BD410DRAFT_806934 [Rickenella mellea]|uniref:F-box domain-containing protein n=1 Tax=Rickenella mellea TaxID=50990 RepID=A0A4Y7PSA6_9AGAM|nr:hypothetical protein BD410DRAFT_806934 [Rickenella mellea]
MAHDRRSRRSVPRTEIVTEVMEHVEALKIEIECRWDTQSPTDLLHKKWKLPPKLSPAQRLIPDVLSMIFIQCLPDTTKCSSYPRPSRHHAPLVLGRICRAWRDSALSTPRLWSCLKISNQWKCSVGVQEWLRRSGTHPLSISWYGEDGDLSNPLENGRAIRALVAQSHRWENIQVRDSGHILERFLVPISFSVPTLKTLILEAPLNDPWEGTVGAQLSNAPKLRRLLLSGRLDVHFHGGMAQQLRELVIVRESYDKDSYSLERIANILASCPSLESGEFYVEGNGDMLTDTDIIAPSLQSLSLDIPWKSYVTDIGPFLSRLTLPALKDLTLSPWGVFTPWLPQLRSLIERSQTSLASLSLVGTFGIEEYSSSLLDCLRMSPKLRQLSLETMSTGDSLMHALTSPPKGYPGAHDLCPRLRNLVIRHDRPSKAAATAMLVSRRHHPLKYVRLSRCGLKPLDDAQLAKCTKRGLKLIVE